MIKKLFSLLILYITCAPAQSQQVLTDLQWKHLNRFSKSYFRSDPFTGEFSGFLTHLINDPLLTRKNTRKRTDSTLYSFNGVFTNYNPFFFKPKRVEILLEETPVQYDDSPAGTDTLFTYQLIAYADNTNKGKEEITREFEKIHRQNKNKYYDSNYREIKEGDEVTITLHNYFVPAHLLSPLSIALIKLKQTNEIALNLTLRFKLSENKAILPAPLYNP